MKKKTFIYYSLIITGLCFCLFACAHKAAIPEAATEKFIWASQTPPPEWIDSVPKPDGPNLYFVGISDETVASEKNARNNARKDAINKVVEYYGTMVKIKSKEISTSFGLSSTVVDPTVAALSFTKHFAANVSKQLLEQEIYKEKWEKPTGIGWKVYALCRVPKDIANISLKNTAEQNILNAQEAARKAATRTAKQQAENAAEFWEKMKKDGFAE